jgi:hypothetical protein
VTGFTPWYHGTLRETVPLIEQGGLTASKYAPDPHGLGWPYHILARRREQVEPWAHPAAGTGAIVILRVPDDNRTEYLTCPDGSCYCKGGLTGLMKPLPLSMVYAVENT